MVLIYGEARGHSELTRQIYGERFLQGILPNARTFVNVVQHLREMNKRDLGSHFSCKIYCNRSVRCTYFVFHQNR
jgi:hypothetical protein